MAQTTPKMLLRLWDQLSDLFSHDQLADNFSKIDFHDHTPGRGVQIPTEGIFDGAVTAAKLASGLDATPAYTSYKNMRGGSGVLSSGTTAGTYILSETRPQNIAITAASAYAVWYFDPADYAVTGRSTFLRIRSSVICPVTLAGSPTVVTGLYPVTAVSSGGALTLGTVVTGSTVTFVAPTGVTMTTDISTDFAVPAAGWYAFAFTSSALVTAGTSEIRSDLQMKQV